MGTHLLNVTGRKKIIHAKSGNTEVKIIGENAEVGVKYSIELKLSEKHNFPNCTYPNDYLNNKISYILDEEKRKGMEVFLSMII